jgi:hypothetical protein
VGTGGGPSGLGEWKGGGARAAEQNWARGVGNSSVPLPPRPGEDKWGARSDARALRADPFWAQIWSRNGCAAQDNAIYLGPAAGSTTLSAWMRGVRLDRPAEDTLRRARERERAWGNADTYNLMVEIV